MQGRHQIPLSLSQMSVSGLFLFKQEDNNPLMFTLYCFLFLILYVCVWKKKMEKGEGRGGQYLAQFIKMRCYALLVPPVVIPVC